MLRFASSSDNSSDSVIACLAKRNCIIVKVCIADQLRLTWLDYVSTPEVIPAQSCDNLVVKRWYGVNIVVVFDDFYSSSVCQM